jgi:hypothetical protein
MAVQLRQGDQALMIDNVEVTASAAELNKLVGSGAKVASGTVGTAIAAPTGGATIDAQSRTAITSIIAILGAFGLIPAS